MKTPYPPSTQTSSFEPSAEQLARDAELRRFNRLYLYLPIGIAAAIVTLIPLLMLIVIFLPESDDATTFISALSALVIIVFSVPLILLGAVILGGIALYLFDRRQRRKEFPQTGPLAYRSRLQVLMWRLDFFLDRVKAGTEKNAPKVAEPVMKANAFLAYLQSWWDSLVKK